jgi:hypothetical protein
MFLFKTSVVFVKLEVQLICVAVNTICFHLFEPAKYLIYNKITCQNKRTVNRNSLKRFLIVFCIIWHNTVIIPQGRPNFAHNPTSQPNLAHNLTSPTTQPRPQPNLAHNPTWPTTHPRKSLNITLAHTKLIHCSWHTDLDYGFYRVPDLETWLTVDVIDQQGMLTFPFYLIPPLIYSEIQGPYTSTLWFVYPIGLMRLITVRQICYFIYISSCISEVIISKYCFWICYWLLVVAISWNWSSKCLADKARFLKLTNLIFLRSIKYQNKSPSC